MRDGHKICGQHARATSPTYIDSPLTDGYDHLEQVMAELASIDDEFRRRLIAAIERTEGRWPEKAA